MRVPGAPAHGHTLRVASLLPAIFALALLAAPSAAIAGAKWAPIPPADMALTRPTLDPEAGAEILLWSIRVQDETQGSSIHTFVRHELRTKVFDARGAEEAGRAEISYLRGVTITGIAARTVRPDGSVVELSKDQIFDRTIVKGAETKLNVKAFAFPSVTPGSVLEYRWTEIRYDDDAGDVYLEFERDHPVRQIDLRVRPLPLAGTGFKFRMRTFNMPTPAFVEDRDGFQYAILPPVPARREEPHMPPRRHAMPWAILYYEYGDDPLPDDLWSHHAESVLRSRGPAMEADGSVKAMALEISAPGDTPARKADLLYDWCRTKVEDVWDDRLALSETERLKEPKNRKAAETLKRRRGTALDLVYLFVAMCRSVGIPARLVATADRSDFSFDSRLALPRLLDRYCAAIPNQGGWRFYDPSARWLGPGLIWWAQEGEEVLILDKPRPQFARIPLSPPESSMVLRSARVRLFEDGRAEGSLRRESRGHQSAGRHERYDELTAESRVEQFRKDGPMEAKEAAFDSIRIEGADDPMAPVVEYATVAVPGYAQPVADRLLVPLSFFRWKGTPDFPSPTRRYPIYFSYPWAASDTVRIELPEGYEVESLPEIEPPITKGVARFRTSALVSTDGRTVLFIRDFSFGVGGVISFPVEQYPSLKNLFDGLQRRDEATLSLKRKA